MKNPRLVLASVLLFFLSAIAFSQPTTLCWSAQITNPGADTYGYFSVFDSTYDVYVCSQVVETGKPDLIKIQKFGEFGNLENTVTITSVGTATPTGFAVDSAGDCFITYDQYDQYYTHTSMFAGWSSTFTQLFSKALTPPQNDDLFGRGIAVDANNNVYAVFAGSSTGSPVTYMKFTRLGTAVFSKTAPLVGTYAHFDPTGRCGVIGYHYTSMGVLAGCSFAVFNSTDGSLQKFASLNNTATLSYYYGGSFFDDAGDYFINLIKATGPNSATSYPTCYDNKFKEFWQTAAIPGYAWYAAAKSPTNSVAYGTSDVYNSTGQFIADTSGGSIVWNETTEGQPIGWVGVDDILAIYQAPDGSEHTVFIDYKTGNGIDVVVQKAPLGNPNLASVGVGQVNNKWQSQTVTVSVSHRNKPQARPGAETSEGVAPTAPTTESPALYGCFVYMLRSAYVVNSLIAPRGVDSGAPFTVTVSANAALTTGSITVPLTVTNGKFSNGLTTENVVISAPSQTATTTVAPTPTAVSLPVTVTARQDGSIRTVTTYESAPGFASVALNTTVIAAAATTDPYTVTLNGVAPAAGVGITVTSSNTAVIPNATATVVGGGKTVSGSLTVNKVTGAQSVTLTFKTSTGASLVKTVTVNP